jgi:hypothetical protein
MQYRDLESYSSTRLARLISMDDPNLFALSQDDLAALLQHQLDSPMAAELMSVPGSPEAAHQMQELLAGRPGETFASLLLRDDPPLKMLDLVKAFAKSAQSAGDAAVPREVAIILYYAAIAAALVRLNERMTQLSDEDLAAGLEWALSHAWLDPRLRPLLAAARNRAH